MSVTNRRLRHMAHRAQQGAAKVRRSLLHMQRVTAVRRSHLRRATHATVAGWTSRTRTLASIGALCLAGLAVSAWNWDPVIETTIALDGPELHRATHALRPTESLPDALFAAGLTRQDAEAAAVAWPAPLPPSGTTLDVRTTTNDATSIAAWLGTGPITVVARSHAARWRVVIRAPQWRRDLLLTSSTVEPDGSLTDALMTRLAHTADVSREDRTLAAGLSLGIQQLLRNRAPLGMRGALSGGRRIAVLFERRVASHDAALQDVDAIHAVSVQVPGQPVWTALRFVSPSGVVDYYDPLGQTTRGGAPAVPVRNAAISSPFARRRLHPILGISRPHAGMDYAAPMGSPVRATLPGAVTFAGWRGGYGLCVILRHTHGVTTTYGHLSRLGRIRVGSVVNQGDIIGAVGQRGLATGPHLHYELRIHDIAVDPERTRIRFQQASMVPATNWQDWDTWRRDALNLLQPAIHSHVDTAMIVAVIDTSHTSP